MQVEKKEIAPTLRSEAHAHEPVICCGFSYKQGAKAGSIAFCPEQSPTLRGGSSTQPY